MRGTAIVLLCAATTLAAQSPQTAPQTFEVVSVKPGLSPAELGRQAAANGGQFPQVVV